MNKYTGPWIICSHCRGEGASSAYLGAFTMDEFNDAFDPEEQERYFHGEYDRQCDHCEGTGKIRSPGNDDEREDAEYEAEARRMAQYEY